MNLRRSFQLLLCLAALLCSCVPRQPPEPPLPPSPPPPQVLYEEDVRPVERPQLQITGVDEQRSGDHRTATVVGTLINRGNGTTREVSITVQGLDKSEAEVMRLPAMPSSQRIAPGDSATFRASFERLPEIDHYRVEAISR